MSDSSGQRHKYSVRRSFTEREDQMIIDLVERLGVHCWNQIAEKLGTRTSRQCRERWRHYLKPEIKMSSWTPEEDSILEKKFDELGPKWSKIAHFIPGRTEINAKNRWARLSRLKQKQTDNSSRQRYSEMRYSTFNENDLLKNEDSEEETEEEEEPRNQTADVVIKMEGNTHLPQTEQFTSLSYLLNSNHHSIPSSFCYQNPIYGNSQNKCMHSFVEMALVRY